MKPHDTKPLDTKPHDMKPLYTRPLDTKPSNSACRLTDFFSRDRRAGVPADGCAGQPAGGNGVHERQLRDLTRGAQHALRELHTGARHQRVLLLLARRGVVHDSWRRQRHGHSLREQRRRLDGYAQQQPHVQRQTLLV